MPTSDRLQDSSARRRAFLIHLAISAAVLLCAVAVILALWYPPRLLAAGGVEGLVIVAGVTLVLGPVLTLVIFNPGKKTVLIKLDLVIIALLQAVSVGAGLWMIHQQRPVLEVLSDDGVHIHAAAELAAYGMDLDALALEGKAPHAVVLELPEDPAQANDLRLIHQLLNDRPITLSEELYLGLAAAADEDVGGRMDRITDRYDDELRQLVAGLDAHPDCTWLPLYSIHVTGLACYSSKGGVLRIEAL